MPVQNRLSFQDAGAFCAATQGFDIDFHQLDRGILKADLSFLTTAEISVQHVRFSRRFHQQGSCPAGMLTFGLPDTRTTRNWRGASLDTPALLNISRPSGYDSVSERDFSAYTFAVTERLLQQELDALGSTKQASDIRASDDWCLPDANVRGLLRSIGHQLVSDTSISIGHPTRLAELQSSLLHILAHVITANEAINVRSSARQRNRAISRTLDLIFGSSDSISVGNLQVHSGVCWRTLDRAFKDRFGIGPKQYMVAVRLTSAREALQSAPPHRTVTEIASEWGFGHLGRFSSDYRQMFGELPSRTLNK